MSEGNGQMPAVPQVQLRFSSDRVMAVFMQLDLLVGMTGQVANQMQIAGQEGPAKVISAISDTLGKFRDEFYRQDQSAIVIAGPGALPRGGARG